MKSEDNRVEFDDWTGRAYERVPVREMEELRAKVRRAELVAGEQWATSIAWLGFTVMFVCGIQACSGGLW